MAFDTQTVAVEVATTLNNPQRVRETLPDLLARYPGCWYFVGPHARPRLERLLTDLGPAVQAAVRLIDLPSVRGGVVFGPSTREHPPLTDGADGGD